jgi:DNA-binding NtrC family response regulator
VILVDDDREALSAYETALALDGITNVQCLSDPRSAIDVVRREPVTVATLDLIMPGMRGDELLRRILAIRPETVVLVATGVEKVDTAVELMRAGASDYLVKPVQAKRLTSTIRRAIETFEVRRENSALREHMLSGELAHPEAFSRIITRDARMNGIFGYVEAIAPTSLPLLISGETGVGKELFANAVHIASGRSGEFVAVNTAGLDDHLFSDTLFGHVKGAFTGAVSDRPGMIARAAGGTLFLDEVGDLGHETQVKLLRLVQQREYMPLGSDRVKRTDTRFVFATNCDLKQSSTDGAFRQDLYYRLRSHEVRIPPLRERRGDVGLLAKHFWSKAAGLMGGTGVQMPPELERYLATYDFPGNVRELEGLIYEAAVREKAGMPALDITAELDLPDPKPLGLFEEYEQLPTLREVTESLVHETLRRYDGNQTAAARSLGLTRSALNKRLNRSTRE